jgi:hypothetical protein
VVLLGGVVVLEWADLHEELFNASPLDLRDALHRLLRLIVGVVDSGLVLTSYVVTLSVFNRGVDHIEVSQQQRVEAHLLGVVFHPHGLPKAGLALADGLVIGICLAGAVGVAALGVDDAGDGLHQLFHSPEAAARQIDDIFRGIHIGDLLIGPVKSRSVHVCFLFALFLRHSLLPGGAAAEQQHCGEKQCQYTSIHRVSSFSGIRAHSALSQSCLLPRPGHRTVYSSDPRTQPKPVESHGLDVTAQVPVVQPT